LAKLALHGLPVFASAVPFGGPYIADVSGPLPSIRPRPRACATAFGDPGLVDGLRAAGRPILVLSGVASEMVVQRTALDALAGGFNVHVAVDACGGLDARAEDAVWRRVVQAGGTTTSVIAIAAELAGDFDSDAGARTLEIIAEMLEQRAGGAGR
jgi:hypothetical protein